MTKARATLIRDSGSRLATMEDLEKVPTPEPTDTWKPIPHAQVPEVITQMVKERGWNFVTPKDKYQFALSPDGAKMFGVTKIVIPDVAVDHEFQIAVGFRNSHDKSLALRIATGANVCVCDNLVFSGDIQVRRIHTRLIDPIESANIAFDKIPDAANRLVDWFGGLREKRITQDAGISLLAECVEKKALPLKSFMPARQSFLKAYAGDNDQIDHGRTYWAVYQAVTEQFKKYQLARTQAYSLYLNQLFGDRVGIRMNGN